MPKFWSRFEHFYLKPTNHCWLPEEFLGYSARTIYYAGSYPDKAGNLYGGSRAFFLGVLAQVYQRTEQGDIKIKEVPTAQVPFAEVQQMIDLGVVFNDSTVVDCVERCLAGVGG